MTAKKHELDFDDVRILKKVHTKWLLKMHQANQIILHENVVVIVKHVSPVFYNLIKMMENDNIRHNLPSHKVTAP